MTESLKALRTVFSVYRSHCGLLWRIMLPVAIIAIPAYLVVSLSIFPPRPHALACGM